MSTIRSKTVYLVVHGRVQGVCFRASMAREARNRSVAGWVRNRVDGTVEAVVHGLTADVDGMVRWAERGPEYAYVERLEVREAEGSYRDFEVLG